jgi:hypothetical protein
MLIHWIGVVFGIGWLIFLILGFFGAGLVVQLICYTAWRSPSATMREKTWWSVSAITVFILEVAFIYACLTEIHADGSPALLPKSDDTYWAIFLLAFGCHALMLRYLVRLDANTVKSLVREVMAQRRQRRALKRKSSST